MEIDTWCRQQGALTQKSPNEQNQILPWKNHSWIGVGEKRLHIFPTPSLYERLSGQLHGRSLLPPVWLVALDHGACLYQLWYLAPLLHCVMDILTYSPILITNEQSRMAGQVTSSTCMLSRCFYVGRPGWVDRVFESITCFRNSYEHFQKIMLGLTKSW